MPPLAAAPRRAFTSDSPLQSDGGVPYGRVAYTDMHVEAVAPGITADYSGGSNVVPNGCAMRDLDAQEQAMELMLFDLTSCLTPGGGEQPGP